MTPLYIFLETTKSLAKKPIDFWSSTEKQKALKNLATAINKLEGILESKKLTNTHAYKQLKGLEKTVSTSGLNEVLFIQSLNGLVDIYKHSPANNKINELVTLLDVAVSQTKPKILEHHLLLERQEQKAQKMSQVEQDKKDREIIQKIGIFYVLEYTLQALYEFTVVNDEDKKRLLKEGLKTKAGNLPAYLPLEDTLRKELCYALFDKQLRNELLAIFYKFEEVCYTTNLSKIGLALQQFNLSVLKAFSRKGLQIFKGFIYMEWTPYTRHTSHGGEKISSIWQSTLTRPLSKPS